MSKQKLILIGGGGHCRSCIEVIESTGLYEISGILDVADNSGKKILGYEIIAGDDAIENYVSQQAVFLVTIGQIGNPERRIAIHNKVIEKGGSLITAKAKTACISKHSEIGYGTVIMHQAVVNAAAKIGNGCIINTFANIEHDAVIGDFCHISTGVMINGTCSVGERTFVGSGTVLHNNVSIVSGCIISAGSVVTKNITVRGIYRGNPARLIRTV
jgi:sugar O-acyltransferase (sialic acid O-acetyltransferase NeuD family)